MVSGTEQKNSTSLFLPWMSLKATKGSIALTPKIDWDQAAMGLSPITSAVFLIVSNFGKTGASGRWYIRVASSTPSRIKRECYVCNIS
jgi:hypothetical protein